MNDIYMERPSEVLVNTMVFSEYTLYLTGSIEGPENYMEHFAALKAAGEGDIVVFHLNTPGGDLAAATMIIDHIRDCPARVIGVVGMECASAGSAIMLAMDELRVSEMSTALIHSFSYSVGGNASSVHNHADFNIKLNERWIRATYKDFLPEEKILRVLDGIDILLDADQIVEYWNNRERKRSGEEDSCACEDGHGIGIYPPYDPSEEDERVFDIYQVPITNHRTVNGKIRMTVEVEPEVFARIKDKTAELCVDIDVEDGA